MKPNLTYTLAGKNQTIEVFVGSGLLAHFSELLKQKAPAYRYALITDSTVEKLYGEKLVRDLNSAGLTTEIFSFPAGENSKNEATKQRLDHALLEKNYGRDTVILALGGGVVGDLAGFVSATYLRGISYVQIPTTVLAMVDSSIGGKVGIDTPFGKNLLGAFWHPQLIVVDTNTLTTLSERERINGWFEALKMFVCLDAETFARAKKGFDPSLLERAMQLKMEVVEADEREQGLRAVLNFGHSVGHALEQLSHYSIPHGYAVALGMLVEARASVEMGALNEKDFEELCRVLFTLELRPEDLASYDFESVWIALQNDKKNREGKVRWVQLKGLGESHTEEVSKTIAYTAWEHVLTLHPTP